jgi:hypothetical protein
MNPLSIGRLSTLSRSLVCTLCRGLNAVDVLFGKPTNAAMVINDLPSLRKRLGKSNGVFQRVRKNVTIPC